MVVLVDGRKLVVCRQLRLHGNILRACGPRASSLGSRRRPVSAANKRPQTRHGRPGDLGRTTILACLILDLVITLVIRGGELARAQGAAVIATRRLAGGGPPGLVVTAADQLPPQALHRPPDCLLAEHEAHGQAGAHDSDAELHGGERDQGDGAPHVVTGLCLAEAVDKADDGVDAG